MGFHTFPLERAEELNDPERYRYGSREELLEMLDLEPTDRVADLGAGIGFYALDVAPFVDTLYAVDLQVDMHRLHRQQENRENIELVAATVAALPFRDRGFDAAFSVMTHHEYMSQSAMEEIARVLRPGGRLVTIDWSASGYGEDGPPLDERYDPEAIATHLEEVGFSILDRRERPETVAITAALPTATRK